MHNSIQLIQTKWWC